MSDDEHFDPPLRRALLRVWGVFAGPPIESTYRLTRSVLLRSLGGVYLVAFMVALLQLVPLIGSVGLTPIEPWLDRFAAAEGGRAAGGA